MEPADANDSPVGSSEGMVDNLVTQFSSALDCFRELVQNSIDAGTPRIEIWMEFLAGDGHEGTIAIHVDDFGEGMDEAIIDEELTQLFASTKDEDLTKIGKFGIGFVSVFALQPRAVLVHTGRSGEYWEVLFHEDRSFSKTRVDNPVEGTQITIFLAGEYHRYQELAEEIPKTLRHWCSHSTVEITFEDRTNNDDFAPPEVINEEFEVEGINLQHVEHEGTEIALAYSEQPVYGFYNRGLTLALTDVGDDVLGRWKRRFRYVAFKIKSRYLEHTLARDSVIQDAQYERAMNLLEQAANGPLLESLIDELEALAGAERLSVEQYHRYARSMAFLSHEPPEQIAAHSDRQVLRCVNGPALSFAEARAQLHDDGRLLLNHEATTLTDTLGEQGVPVLLGVASRRAFAADELRAVSALLIRLFSYQESSTAKGLFLGAVDQVSQLLGSDGISHDQRIERSIRESLVWPEAVYFPIACDDEPDEALVPLLDDATALLQEAGIDVEHITTGVLTGSGDDVPLFVVAEDIADLIARPDDVLLDPGASAKGGEERFVELMAKPTRKLLRSRTGFDVAVNRNHPQFDIIVRLYERDPAMGAYLLARGLSLSQNYMVETDQAMVDASLADIKDQYLS